MKTPASVAIVAILVAACGGSSPAATTAGIPTQPPGISTQPPGVGTQPPAVVTNPPPTSPPIAGGAGSTIHVVVAGGPQAGTYDATGIKYDCNTSSDGSGATYVDMAKTEGVTSLTFSSIGGGTSSSTFYFQVVFGAISASQAFLEIQTLDPASARGSGTATLQDNGSTIKWTIDGTSADGIGVQATVECGPVDRR